MNTSTPEPTPCGAIPIHGSDPDRRAEFPCTLPAGHDGRHHCDIADGTLDWDDRQTEYSVTPPFPRDPKHERDTGGPIDPTLLARRVKRVRQAEAALTAVKRTLADYINSHATNTCQSENTFSKCDAPTDGVLLVSCGHFAFLCAEHASKALRVHGEVTCTQKAPPLHELPAVGVTLEWCGL